MAKDSSQSFLAKAFDPLKQGLIIFIGFITVIMGGYLVQGVGLPIPERFAWMSAAVFLLCFSIFNSILFLSTDNKPWYWGRSMYSFLGLAVVNGGIAYLITGLSISEAGSYRWIYMVITFCYFVFLSMVGFIRLIVNFAQREEWNQPRMRSRKRRP